MSDLRGRADIDWNLVTRRIEEAAAKVDPASDPEDRRDPATTSRHNAIVYNRMRNSAGFNSQDWKTAYNQVKALSDRSQLDEPALARFVRFGYGHHTAAALAQRLRVGPEVFVTWLAAQDYVAVTVGMRALGLTPDLFEAAIAVIPWRDLPTEEDRVKVKARFEALSHEDASAIFEAWRANSFGSAASPPVAKPPDRIL